MDRLKALCNANVAVLEQRLILAEVAAALRTAGAEKEAQEIEAKQAGLEAREQDLTRQRDAAVGELKRFVASTSIDAFEDRFDAVEKQLRTRIVWHGFRESFRKLEAVRGVVVETVAQIEDTSATQDAVCPEAGSAAESDLSRDHRPVVVSRRTKNRRGRWAQSSTEEPGGTGPTGT
ncbi:MAG: hypothetical protein HY897_02600 [Deltaproteobacteria bacterium]|nr:hypothetical protein [Deltaproteobacteria bacterium]